MAKAKKNVQKNTILNWLLTAALLKASVIPMPAGKKMIPKKDKPKRDEKYV